MEEIYVLNGLSRDVFGYVTSCMNKSIFLNNVYVMRKLLHSFTKINVWFMIARGF